jgi:DNA ligase-1
MERILEKIEEISAANKATKNALVKRYCGDAEFKKFLTYCLDDSLTFNVTRVSMTEPIVGDFYAKLDELNAKGSANKADKEELAGLGSQSDAHLTVLNKILRKNPDCGYSAKSLHKILPGMVPYFPYQRCSTDDKLQAIFDKPTDGPEVYAFSELKENGQFCRVLMPDSTGEISFETRNGKALSFSMALAAAFMGADAGVLNVDGVDFEMFHSGLVFEGEVLVMNEEGTDYLPRAIGNAIVNKFQGGFGSPEELDRIRFSLWNVLPYNDYKDGLCNLTVEQRRDCVEQLVHNANSPIMHQTESKIVYSVEEAWEHYHEIRSRPVPEGEEPLEGNITKHPLEIWKDGTSGLMAKGKAVKECEVEITGWNYGKAGGKNENRLGSYNIRSSCGKLVGKCSGMSDSIRNRDPEEAVGKICTVKFNAVSKSMDADKVRSFDHARFIEFRDDKHEADSLDYILNLKSKKR